MSFPIIWSAKKNFFMQHIFSQLSETKNFQQLIASVASLFVKFGYDAWPRHSITWSIPKNISSRYSSTGRTNSLKTHFVFPLFCKCQTSVSQFFIQVLPLLFPNLYSGQITAYQSELGAGLFWVPWLGVEPVPSGRCPLRS